MERKASRAPGRTSTSSDSWWSEEPVDSGRVVALEVVEEPVEELVDGRRAVPAERELVVGRIDGEAPELAAGGGSQRDGPSR